jgi:hypothetical protein
MSIRKILRLLLLAPLLAVSCDKGVSSSDTGRGDGDSREDTPVETPMTYDAYIEVMIGTLCDRYEACGFFEELGWNMESCLASADGIDPSRCRNYDPTAGKACIEYLAGATCDEIRSPPYEGCVGVCEG